MGGRKKTSFVDKKSAVTYALLPNHDRQAHSLGLPNTWVRTDNNQGADPFDDGDHVGRELERELRESHSQHVSAGDLSNEKDTNNKLTASEKLELGLPDDGYDYAKHLRECDPDKVRTVESDYANPRSEIFTKSIDHARTEYAGGAMNQGECDFHTLHEQDNIADVLQLLDDISQGGSMETCAYEELQDDIIFLASQRKSEERCSSPFLPRKVEPLSPQTHRAATKVLVRSSSDAVGNERSDDSHFLRMIHNYDDDDLGATPMKDESNIRSENTKWQTLEQLNFNDGNLQKHNVDARTVKSYALNHSEEQTPRNAYLEESILDKRTQATHMYDCESILSLHSNSNHHPKLLEGRLLSEERKLKTPDQQSASIPGIHTCFPLGMKASSEAEFDWRSCTARKGESAQQKKERKNAVKMGRRQARSTKKGLKESFQYFKQAGAGGGSSGDVRAKISVTKMQ